MNRRMLLTALIAAMTPDANAAIQDGPFLQKYNRFVQEMNKLAAELQTDKADLKTFDKCSELWKQLVNDEGWLSDRKHPKCS